MRWVAAFVCAIITAALCRCRWVFSDRWLLSEREGGGCCGAWRAEKGKCFASGVLCLTHAPSAASAPTPASFIMLIKATGTSFVKAREQERERG